MWILFIRDLHHHHVALLFHQQLTVTINGQSSTLVSIVNQGDVFSVCFQQPNLLDCKRRTARRNGIGHCDAMQPFGVEIALYKIRPSLSSNGGSCDIERKKLLPFVKYIRIRGIKIFRYSRFFDKYRSRESDYLAGRRTDREHDAIPEEVIILTSLFASPYQTGLF